MLHGQSISLSRGGCKGQGGGKRHWWFLTKGGGGGYPSSEPTCLTAGEPSKTGHCCSWVHSSCHKRGGEGRRFASEKVQKAAFLAGAASDAQGEGGGRDHAADVSICLAARLPAPHLLSALSTVPKKKKTHEKKHFLTQDVNHTAYIPGLAAK